MSERTPNRTVDMSMINTIDAPTAYLVPAPAEVFTVLARASNYDGTQFVCTRITDAQVKTGALTPFALKAINSAAEGYRSENSWAEASQHFDPTAAKGAYVIFPHMSRTRDTIRSLQDKSGRRLPVTIQNLEQNMPINIANTNLIVTPEHFANSGASSLEEFVQKVKDYGFEGLCVDPYQLRRPSIHGNPSPFGDLNQALKIFLPHSKIVNLSFGRKELGAVNTFDPIAELRDLIQGTNETGVVEMLGIIGENYKGPIAVQIPPRAVKEALGISRPFITPREFIRTHRNIATNIKSALHNTNP